MFFDAMKRKGHETKARDMKTVVPIHNAVNERAWYEIREWERPYEGERYVVFILFCLHTLLSFLILMTRSLDGACVLYDLRAKVETRQSRKERKRRAIIHSPGFPQMFTLC